VPEGDAVWRTARKLHQALSGHTLTRTDFRVPAIATVDLAGGTVVETVSRGKHLLTRVDHDQKWTLHTHLKMEGSWRIYEPGERWGKAGHHARVVLDTGEKVGVGFQLGIVELVLREHEDQVVGHLGPDLLGPDWDEHEAVRRLTADPDRPLGEALLDQRNLATRVPASAWWRTRCGWSGWRTRCWSRTATTPRSSRPATSAEGEASGSTAGAWSGARAAARRSSTPSSASPPGPRTGARHVSLRADARPYLILVMPAPDGR
jgi:hypothetical protein